MGVDASIRASALKWLWRVLWAAMALAVCVALGHGFQRAHWSGFVAAQTPMDGGKREPTVGMLAGAAVLIPPFAADYPAFDGDPPWVHWTPTLPPRSPAMSLRRFGLLLRYSELQPVHKPGQQFEAERALEGEADHPWVLAQVIAGEHFPGTDALRRFVRQRAPDESTWPGSPRLGQAQLVGLRSAVAQGLADTSPMRDDRFLAYDDAGRLLAYIACSNDPLLPRYCLQAWSLEDRGWPVFVTVHYRRTRLADWALIQRGVTEALWSLRVAP